MSAVKPRTGQLSDATPRTTTDSPSPPASLWSCFNCRKRKVRCDRQRPCYHCVKGSLDCSFPSTGRLPTRQSETNLIDKSNRRQLELLARLRQLERIVEDLNSQLEKRDTDENRAEQGVRSSREQSNYYASHYMRSDLQASQKHSRTSERDKAKTPLGVGMLLTHERESQYIEHHFLNTILEELKFIRADFQDSDESESNSSISRHASSPPRGEPFFLTNESNTNQDFWPLPSLIPYIWQVYTENIDPCIKILHVPTISKLLKEFKGRLKDMPTAIQALTFAICLAAVTSMTDEEVRENFDAEKTHLVSKYKYGTEQALSRSGFLFTKDFVILQAFIIYLEVVNLEGDPQSRWVLNGLLFRLALSIGLHRDGSHFPNLSPFDVEMRRRLWWQICLNDGRTGNCTLSEAGLPEASFDVSFPSQLDDSEMKPDMIELPPASHGFTDATFTITCCHLWRFKRKFKRELFDGHGHAKLPDDTYDKGLKMVQDAMREVAGYLRGRIQLGNPLHYFLRVYSTLLLVDYELAVAMSFRNVWEASEEKMLESLVISSACVDYMMQFRTQADTHKWSWMFRAYIPWHPFSASLALLLKLPWTPTSERTWGLCRKVAESIPCHGRSHFSNKSTYRFMTRVSRYRDEEIKRLRSNPNTVMQLGHLNNSNPATTELHGLEDGGIGFDTSAARERLRLELDISVGKSSRDLVEYTVIGSQSMPIDIPLDDSWLNLDISAYEFDILNAGPPSGYDDGSGFDVIDSETSIADIDIPDAGQFTSNLLYNSNSTESELGNWLSLFDEREME